MKSPRKSFSDKKEYKVLILQNGLKVMLVKKENEDDEEVGKKFKPNIAAVALCVASGCFQDPKDVQGLSHFLEHMIFMGSEKYPKENEFDQFVSAHGGYDNAFTECEHTLFHFDIVEKHLAGALDRFAQFFISPVMSVNSMEREMKAVESEFQSNSLDDEVRVNQLYCSMISEDHPASNFIWGNLRTLRHGIKKEKLYEKLHEFRRKHYVADRMFLCIQSSVDMSRLERTVVKYFSDISRSVVDHQTYKAEKCFDIFKPIFSEKIFFVKSATEQCKLLMSFLMPSIDKELKVLEYIAYLIQYEGPGSLSNYFTDQHLALKVKAKVGSQSFESNSMFSLFTIEVNLTSRALRNFNEVLEPIFAFLLLLKSTHIDEHKKRYDEFKDIKSTLFKYREESSPLKNVQELAVNMRYYDENDIVVGRETYPQFDEGMLRSMLGRINERRFNLIVLSDHYQKFDKVEKWFGTEYAEIEFPKAYIKLWNERWLLNELFLPKPNEFICKNFDVYKSSDETSSKYPKNIFDSVSCQTFHKLDEKYLLPHGHINVFLTSNVTKSSVLNLNLTSIFSMCVKNFLSEKLYPATIVGYTYKLHSVDDGIVLKLHGFYDKLPFITEIITKTIQNLAALVDENIFETFKNELKKNCYSCLSDGSLLNDDTRLAVLNGQHRSFYDRYDNIDVLRFQEFKQFCDDFLSSLSAKVLIQGNFLESQALDITKLLVGNLKLTDSKDQTEESASNIRQLHLGSSYLKTKSLRRNNKNSIIRNYYQIGQATISMESKTKLLVSLMNEPLFDILRSHEQLGYGVACTFRKNFGVLGITITVEYQNKSAAFVDEKIEEFLGTFCAILRSMSLSDFNSSKQVMMSLKLAPDADLEQEVMRNFEEIRSGEIIFDRHELEVFEIEKLSKDDIFNFFNETFLSKAETRKLSIQVIADVKDQEQSLKSLLSCNMTEFINKLEALC